MKPGRRPPHAEDQRRRALLETIVPQLGAMAKEVEAVDLKMLAYLIGMACQEAERLRDEVGASVRKTSESAEE